MQEKLAIVFKVSKFKYVTLSDTFNYYSFNHTTQEEKKKRFITKDYFGGRGGGRGNSRMFYLWENCKLP